MYVVNFCNVHEADIVTVYVPTYFQSRTKNFFSTLHVFQGQFLSKFFLKKSGVS